MRWPWRGRRANAIAPVVWFWLGILPLAGLLALPASVLAAVVERPFVSRAGVSRHALWYSLQANFVSLLIGHATFWVLFVLFLLWPPLAILLSTFSERAHYARFAASRAGPLRWWWIFWGNLLSSLLLAVIPLVALALKARRPAPAWLVEPYQGLLLGVSVGGSLTVFLISFFVPVLSRRLAGPPNPARQRTWPAAVTSGGSGV